MKNESENAREKQKLINGFNFSAKLKQNNKTLFIKINEKNIATIFHNLCLQL